MDVVNKKKIESYLSSFLILLLLLSLWSFAYDYHFCVLWLVLVLWLLECMQEVVAPNACQA